MTAPLPPLPREILEEATRIVDDCTHTAPPCEGSKWGGCSQCIARALAARRGGEPDDSPNHDPARSLRERGFRRVNDRRPSDPVGTRLAGAQYKLTEAEQRLVLRAEVTSPGLAVIISRLEMHLLEVRAALRLWESAAVGAAPTPTDVEAALRAAEPWLHESCYPKMARAVLALWEEAKG